jgi:DUF3048 family protein
MRSCLVLLAALVAACGGNVPIPGLASSTPTTWPLRGTPASDADAHRRPIVVKVANDPTARPQSGLAQADLILEIPVEGGITRYALVFHSQEPARVGPVRSARQSDLNYLSTFKAILAHVGASEPVTKLVREAAAGGAFLDVDEFQHPEAFERVPDKVAPYNAYTSGSKIREAAGAPGRDRVDVPTLQFDASGGRAAGTGATSLVVPYPGAGRVSYTYDAAAAAYKRTQDGKPTTDDATKREVLPDNVVVIKTEVKQIPGTADVTGAPSVDFRATGTGAVVVLRDGKRFDGKWTRQGTEMYRFADAAGAAIALKPGLTWIHIVPEEFDLSG